MQKSFILALGAFIIAAFLFVFGGQQTETQEVVTSFKVDNNGITTKNSITGESFVIADDVIKGIEEEVMNIEPASGTAEIFTDVKDVVDAEIGSDIDAVLSIENDVIDMVEDAKTAETEVEDSADEDEATDIKIKTNGLNIEVGKDIKIITE